MYKCIEIENDAKIWDSRTPEQNYPISNQTPKTCIFLLISDLHQNPSYFK